MTFIIAEAGVNHNGNIENAYKLIEAASMVGADAVKFQTFIASEEISTFAPKANYQKNLTDINETQLEMVKKLELTSEQHISLINKCDTLNIEFMSSAFDLKSLELLNELHIKRFKIPSGEITNLPYLRKIAKFKIPIILSTGMCRVGEIDQCLEILENSGYNLSNVTILHCNSEYPTPLKDVNLRVTKSLKTTFGLNVGYSDHTMGTAVSVAAVALGATVIEKHLTLDRNMQGPDHLSSLEPNEFKQMVDQIRSIEIALGSKIKKPTNSEMKNINIVRKSIVAKVKISKGEIFSDDNLTVKRPGTGLSPMNWDILIGMKSDREYEPDEFIKL